MGCQQLLCNSNWKIQTFEAAGHGTFIIASSHYKRVCFVLATALFDHEAPQISNSNVLSTNDTNRVSPLAARVLFVHINNIPLSHCCNEFYNDSFSEAAAADTSGAPSSSYSMFQHDHTN